VRITHLLAILVSGGVIAAAVACGGGDSSSPATAPDGGATDDAGNPIDDTDAGEDAGPPKLVFVTRQEVPPTMDLATASARCADEAKGKLAPEKWLAWIVFTMAPEPPVGRSGWKLPNGTIVADSTQKLFEGRLRAPINVSADGATISGDVWTGVTSDGAPGANCEDWTSKDGQTFGQIGRSDAADVGATAANFKPCDQTAHLYCFEKSP
jgi:hypothetical protein